MRVSCLGGECVRGRMASAWADTKTMAWVAAERDM